MSTMRGARTETSAGGVLFRCTPQGPRYLVILDSHRNWGFPKGHLGEGESAADAARREVTEETGLDDLVLHESLGTIDWYFRLEGRPIHKYCHLFLFEAPRGEAVPQADEGIAATVWCPAQRALATLSHENTRAILRKAVIRVSGLCRERRGTGAS